ncbi:microcin-processing peptidase 1. Unknown type peptidase. MEROPS family U62 [Consotaella salsifontis]|uniref:PmbA protein n=2 Tax=Consotaella salsifontis TaxID=1365950 RepID=A0A1T4PY27_9HYPH|nr:TldD/PmbA family protein [Consotaella salsifontis]SJZ96460.1 microcin-processing peptidase 1. Unknown type peptidase. MEROPS family U62 [Consotaella salsifontis]
MDEQTEKLLDMAERLIEAGRRAGADSSDAAVVRSASRSVSVRLGAVEETDSAESADVALRVFVGKRSATVSADASADVERLAERAVAMARVSPEDPFAGLADPALLAKDVPDLDLFDGTEPASDAMLADALAMEEAALAVSGVTNSNGAGVSAGWSGLLLATSTGFRGSQKRSGFSRSASVIAGEGTRMQRDYDFDSRMHFADLNAPEAIGRAAGERAVRRLDPGKAPTGRYPVIFDPRMARGFIGHLLGAINGASIARKTSFLKDAMGQMVLPAGVSITDEPMLRHRPGSRPFDGEGLQGKAITLVEDGRLASWLLDSATARELGLESNGRASRSASSISPSSTNVIVSPGVMSPDELIRDTHQGLYVTELIGHGANIVTGDYSRGASGFLIENGQIGAPVAEITIAGNLRDLFRSVTFANDGETRFSIVAPTLRLESMTVAGR